MFIAESVGIIADDLTGANDTALQFFLKGCNTKILTTETEIPENAKETNYNYFTSSPYNCLPEGYMQDNEAKNIIKCNETDFKFSVEKVANI